MSQPGPSWGAFCLANDAVLDWVLPLAESLRTYAPDLPLLFIPFDARTKQLERLADLYGYGLFDHPEIDRCGEVGRLLYPESEFDARGFRKLAAFQGPFERFLSLDSDVLLLGPLSDLRSAVERSDLDLLFFDTDVEQVHRGGPWRDERARRGVRSFNAGLFAARRGLLDAERLSEQLGELPGDWRSVLVPNAEQPFLNFFAEERGWRIAGAHEIVADTCSTCWAAAGRLVEYPGGFRLSAPGRWDDGWRIRFAHWAGNRLSPSMPNRDVHDEFRYRAEARFQR